MDTGIFGKCAVPPEVGAKDVSKTWQNPSHGAVRHPARPAAAGECRL